MMSLPDCSRLCFSLVPANNTRARGEARCRGKHTEALSRNGPLVTVLISNEILTAFLKLEASILTEQASLIDLGRVQFDIGKTTTAIPSGKASALALAYCKLGHVALRIPRQPSAGPSMPKSRGNSLHWLQFVPTLIPPAGRRYRQREFL